MDNEIIRYIDMCLRENVGSLQRGMNYHLGGEYSVILMSVRSNSPYRDEVLDDGDVLIYEGHDVDRTNVTPTPKIVDQPEFVLSGKKTQNGKFHSAAQAFKNGGEEPELVRVYEKIKPGIWTYNGLFELTDSWQERDENRSVFKFRLEVSGKSEVQSGSAVYVGDEHTRIIPSHIKQEVWKRDAGKCVTCGASDELHFDHILPYSEGGTSLLVSNIQLLCARHNLRKSNKIQ